MEVRGHDLLLTVENTFYEAWLREPENMWEMETILRRYVQCPADMKLEVLVEEDLETSKKIKEKLQRRYMKSVGK